MLGKVTDDRILEAMHCATTTGIALALGVGSGRAQERMLDAPEEVVVLKPPGRPTGAPNVWLEVPQCGAMHRHHGWRGCGAA